MFEYWQESDLKRLPSVRRLGMVFSADNGANKIGFRVYDDGEAYTLTGDISASIIRSDGVTITKSGSKDGNTAWVILPEEAYAVPGILKIVLKVTNGTQVTGLGAVEGYVYQTITSEVINNGNV